MTNRRIVVVRDVGALTAAEVEPLVRYLDDPLDTTVLVFVAGGGTIAPGLTKKLKELKAPERAPESEATDKVLIGQAHEQGVLLSKEAADLITKHLGDDAGRVVALVEVLSAAFAPDERLSGRRRAPVPRRGGHGRALPAHQRDRGGRHAACTRTAAPAAHGHQREAAEADAPAAGDGRAHRALPPGAAPRRPEHPQRERRGGRARRQGEAVPGEEGAQPGPVARHRRHPPGVRRAGPGRPRPQGRAGHPRGRGDGSAGGAPLAARRRARRRRRRVRGSGPRR